MQQTSRLVTDRGCAIGRNYHFRPGSFYRVDDRTGFPQRAERTRKQWNGLIVDESVWEPRQPQDLVRGVKDQQSVQDARPLSPAQFVGPVWTTTSYAVKIRTNVIPLNSLSGFSVGDLVAVMTQGDGGTVVLAYVYQVGIVNFMTDLTTENGLDVTTEDGFDITATIGVPSIVINVMLPYSVIQGAQVWNYGPIPGGPISVLGTESSFDITTESGQDIRI